MEIKEMIAVMQAFAEGKEIEVVNQGLDNWVTTSAPLWDWCDFNYRIKPEPKLRPYTLEELLAEMAKGKIAVKHKWNRSIYAITQVCDDFSADGKIQLSSYWKISYETFLKDYQWLDGSLCGVIEEE